MAIHTIGHDVEHLERRYWRAIRERDLEGALALTDDPCIVAGSSGVSTIDHATFQRIMSAADYRITDVVISDVQTRAIGDDIMLMAYKVRESLTLKDGPVTFEASDSSVWVRRDGTWRCAMHSESILGDAYGRDRTQVRTA